MKLELLNKKLIYKIKKFVVLPVVVSSTISLAGCIGKDYELKDAVDNRKNEEINPPITSNYEKIKDDESYIDDSTNEYVNSKIDESSSSLDSIIEDYSSTIESKSKEIKTYTIDNSKLNTIVDFSIVDTNNGKNNISNMYTEYPYCENFNTKEVLSRYYSMKEYNSNGQLKIIVNDKIDKEILVSQIKKNNDDFLKNTKYTMYSNLSDSDLNLAIEAIVYTLNNRLIDDIDAYQLDYNLCNLKVVKTNRGGNASVSDEDMILSINPDVISSLGDRDFFYKVICHEANHLSQINSNLEKKFENYDRNMGILYIWNDLKINPLGYQWLVEASAEKIMQEETSDKNGKVMYEDMIKDLDSLTLSCIFNDNMTTLSIPKITLQPNLEKLFELFKCKNDKDKEELINMLYTFEIIDDTTNDEFDNYYKEKNGESFDINERYLLSNYCAQTLSKIYYKGLIEKLETTSTDLYDVFNLMAINEADMNRITRFYGANSVEQKEFLDYYNELQKNMFELISKSTRIDRNELYQLYDEYYDYKTDYRIDSQLLDDNQKEILSSIVETRFNIKPDDNLYTYVNK